MSFLASRRIFATLSKIKPAVKLSKDIIIKDAAKIAEGSFSTSPVWRKSIVFPLYSRTGLRTVPSVAHLDSLGIAPLGLFSAQYENKLETL